MNQFIFLAVFASIVIVSIVGGIVVYLGTKHKTKWGINTKPTFCSKCNTIITRIRQPQNMQQVLWGGATCSSCGIEVDKWGRELNESTY